MITVILDCGMPPRQGPPAGYYSLTGTEAHDLLYLFLACCFAELFIK
jgi:hypothetical protein